MSEFEDLRKSIVRQIVEDFNIPEHKLIPLVDKLLTAYFIEHMENEIKRIEQEFLYGNPSSKSKPVGVIRFKDYE